MSQKSIAGLIAVIIMSSIIAYLAGGAIVIILYGIITGAMLIVGFWDTIKKGATS